EPLRVVEEPVLPRREVVPPPDVARPADGVGILRAGDDEAAVLPLARGADEEPVERRLAVGAVRPEVAEVPTRGALLGEVLLRVERAIQRARPRGPIAALDAAQYRAAGEGEVEVEFGDEIGREVVAGALLDLRQRHRRVDVI